jgi:MATE family multidrug resistance protein
MLLLIPLAPWIFGLAGHAPEITSEEVTYFCYLTIGTPALLISNALSSFFSGRGQTWIVMLVDAGAAVVNIVLDYWWIFGGLGLPAYGVAGAALVLTDSIAVAMVLSSCCVVMMTLVPAFRSLALQVWPSHVTLASLAIV